MTNKQNPRIVIAIVPPEYEGKYPWKDGEAVLLIGNINNMLGHVAVATSQGFVHWGYDEDSFRDPTENERGNNLDDQIALR